MSSEQKNWSCAGWDDHETFHLETGRRMSFRAKLQWLEEADRMVRFLARKRRWIDKDGVVHEPEPALLAEDAAACITSSAKPANEQP